MLNKNLFTLFLHYGSQAFSHKRAVGMHKQISDTNILLSDIKFIISAMETGGKDISDP